MALYYILLPLGKVLVGFESCAQTFCLRILQFARQQPLLSTYCQIMFKNSFLKNKLEDRQDSERNCSCFPRTQPLCSFVQTSWIKRISLASPILSQSSTGATRMARECFCLECVNCQRNCISSDMQSIYQLSI